VKEGKVKVVLKLLGFVAYAVGIVLLCLNAGGMHWGDGWYGVDLFGAFVIGSMLTWPVLNEIRHELRREA